MEPLKEKNILLWLLRQEIKDTHPEIFGEEVSLAHKEHIRRTRMTLRNELRQMVREKSDK
jgi:hypothetical protein